MIGVDMIPSSQENSSALFFVPFSPTLRDGYATGFFTHLIRVISFLLCIFVWSDRSRQGLQHGNNCLLHCRYGLFWNKGNYVCFLGWWLWLLYNSFRQQRWYSLLGY